MGTNAQREYHVTTGCAAIEDATKKLEETPGTVPCLVPSHNPWTSRLQNCETDDHLRLFSATLFVMLLRPPGKRIRSVIHDMFPHLTLLF